MRTGDFAIMSFSISDCFSESDLLCAEDSAALSTDSPAEFIIGSPVACADEQSIAGFIEDESNFVSGGFEHLDRLRSISVDPSARAQSVAWIFKVQAYYGFQTLTAYLAVNYFDRFLCSYRLPQSSGWTLQLLSVACLSLAAKMEEPLVPLLHHFQVEGAKFIFTSRTIQRMELLVLGVLDWRLRMVTPFSFIGLFTRKVDATETFMGFLSLRSTDIILSNLQEASLLEYRPSSIAAAAVLCAASEIPNLSLVTPEHAESWCDGLSKEKVIDCYKVMQHVMTEIESRKSPKAMQQLRVMNTSRTRVRSSSCCISDCSSPLPSSLSSSSSSSSSSPSYTTNTKRRKLNNSSWVDVDLSDDKRKYESD